jgi:hypothetical protein
MYRARRAGLKCSALRARGAPLAESYPLTLSLPAGSYPLIAFAARRFC